MALSRQDEWMGVEFADKVARRAQILEMQESPDSRTRIVLGNFAELKSSQHRTMAT